MTAAAPEPLAPDVDGVWFQLEVDDPAAGAPYGQYHREDDLVWAEFYAGGTLRSGRLVGHLRPDGTFDAAYCLISATGDLISGECHSVPEFDAQGNIQITDHFRRGDGTTGTSRIRQIPAPVGGCLGTPRSREQVLGGVQRKAEDEARSGVLRASSSNAAMCPPSAVQHALSSQTPPKEA